jgi:nicotinate-nucleotide--dimethylbenzimidazole phosphoribosyltransferase
MTEVDKVMAGIKPVEKKHEETIQARLDRLTKPPRSLGRLEEFAQRLVAINGGRPQRGLKKKVFVFAGDHGVAAEGVSAYPAEVTQQMVINFLRGGAAVR